MLELLLYIVLALLAALIAGSLIAGGTYLVLRLSGAVFHADWSHTRLPQWLGFGSAFAVICWALSRSHCFGAC